MNGFLHKQYFEEIEKHLEAAAKGTLKLSHRLKLRTLTFILAYPATDDKLNNTHNSFAESNSALLKFKTNLQRRKKTSDTLTSSRLLQVPEPARAILLADIANTFRDEIDDYTQIDFGDAKHVKLLEDAIDGSVSKVVNRQGRPVNEPLDEFFIGLRGLYEEATGEKAIAGAHYSNNPKTDFEKLIYLGYQIIRPAQKYPSALKAYQRAISRNA